MKLKTHTTLLFALLAPIVPLRDLSSAKTLDIALAKAGKATAFAFLSARCPCSRAHEEKLSALCQKYAARGVRCIGVHSNANESADEARKYFSARRFSFPIYQDDGDKLADALGALKTPHVFLVSPKGEVLFSGGVDDSRENPGNAKNNYLEKAFAQIAQGQRPNPAEVKALGCFIARP